VSESPGKEKSALRRRYEAKDKETRSGARVGQATPGLKGCGKIGRRARQRLLYEVWGGGPAGKVFYRKEDERLRKRLAAETGKAT